MKSLGWPSCLLFINYVIHYVTSAVPSPPSDSPSTMEFTCMLDEDNMNPELATCLEKGHRYLDRYFTELRWRATQFDTCSEIQEFRECLWPLMTTCPTIRKLHEEWAKVVETIECSCNSSATSCDTDLSCFETQASGTLARRCDAYYRFNVDQHTRSRCHFTEKNIRCKEALMTSACGSSVGDFAFSVYLATSSKRTRKHTCDIPRHSPDPTEEEFQYSDRCPADFPVTMDQCRQQHLLPTTLTFHKDNDLVASGRKSNIQDSCRGYRAYRSCVHPVKRSCRQGMSLVYDYDGRLRTYLKKMEYICGENKRDYIAHLPCFRDMLREKRLTECDHTWNLLDSMLDSVTSHTFYCRRRSNESTQLQIVLDTLRQCYENVLHESCGVAGGDTLGRLMNDVLTDPFYLRYKFKPDCSAHSVPEVMQQEEPRVVHSRQALGATTPESKTASKSSPLTVDSSAALVETSQTSLVLFCILLSLLSLVSR